MNVSYCSRRPYTTFRGSSVPERGTVSLSYSMATVTPTLPCPFCVLRGLDSTLELTGAMEGFQAGSDRANLCLTKIVLAV